MNKLFCRLYEIVACVCVLNLIYTRSKKENYPLFKYLGKNIEITR